MMVSAIIPAFGRQKTLALAVRSAACQRLPEGCELEIIVVDDVSPEPIVAPKTDANSRLIRLEKNSGPAGARNAGIEASRGDYIAFLDSDDVWLPGKLNHQLALAQRTEADVDRSKAAFASSFYMPNRMDGELELRHPSEASTVAEFAGGCWMCPGTTFLAHRSVFERAGLLDGRLRRLEDYEWFLRFAADGGQLRVTREPGAVIAPSAGSKLKPVVAAIETINKNISDTQHLNLSQSERRTLKSYLELEMTAASLSEQKRVKATYHLLKSLALKPRLQASIANYWERSKTVPDDVLATYNELMDATNNPG